MKLKKENFIIIWFVVVALVAFFAGGAAFKHNLYQKIPGTRFLLSFSEPVNFYPAPKQEAAPLFKTKAVEYPYSFIVYGDSRELAYYEKPALISQIISARPSFVIHLGDMVYCADSHQWELFDIFDGRIIKSTIPFYPVLGNHEYRTSTNAFPPDPEKQLYYYFERFKFLRHRRWYSFTYGNSLFLILDTNTDYSPGSEQYTWLMNNLQEQSPGFLFVAFHHPPYSKGYHDRDAEKFLGKIFEKGPVKPDIVFSAHQHNYERYERNGITYIVSGGGGAEQCKVRRSTEDLYNKPGDTFHFCRITVSETTACFEMVALDKDTNTWKRADAFTLAQGNQRGNHEEGLTR